MSQNQKTKMKLAILKDARKIISYNNAIVPRMANCFVKLTTKVSNNLDALKVEKWSKTEADKQFHTSVLKKSKKTVCQVCALGTLFLADIDRNNHATVRDIVDLHSRDQIEERLKNLFTADELQAIEAVFENIPGAHIDAPGLYDAVRGYAYSSIADDGDVLLRILDFLIENDSIVI